MSKGIKSRANNRKSLCKYTNKELFSFLKNNENEDAGVLACICSEVLRRQLKEDKEKEYELHDLELLMRNTYHGFASGEYDFQIMAIEEYLKYYKEYILLKYKKEL